MCGICGIIDLSGSGRATPQNITILNNGLRHRGPDDEGYFSKSDTNSRALFGEETPSRVIEYNTPYQPKEHIHKSPNPSTILLGHRRLSIIDVSPAGHQPMKDAKEELWIVFNGEIYNYIELKETLIQKGHQFLTKTDTEVIIAAYKEWGKDCVYQFNGMWAFVLYDKKNNLIFGSRDRTGVKPFYYHIDNDSFSFASELKALHQLPFVEKQINLQSAFNFLVFNKVEFTQESMFKNLLELNPSHSFSIDLNSKKLSIWKYFEPAVNYEIEKFSEVAFKKHIETTQKHIIDAIRLRLRSDVKIGTCLSGGIDSSSIVGVINSLQKAQKNDHLGEKISVFTSVFENSPYDESSFANEVVNLNDCRWYTTSPNHEELASDLEQLIYCQDVPILSTSTYAQFRVMKLAKEQGVKVLLDGQGADELFAGYLPHYAAKWNGLLRNGRLLELQKALKNGPDSPLSFFLRNQVLFGVLPKSPNNIKKQLLKKYYRELDYLNTDFYHELFNEANDLHKENNQQSLNRTLEYEFFKGPLKRLLKCEDRCSMHFSIESRTPFADDIHLMNSLFDISESYKLREKTSKVLLREAMKDFLPTKIYERKDKLGFATPNNEWISKMRHQIRTYFENCDETIINKSKLLNDFDSFFNPKTPVENYRIFKWISFVIWQKKFQLTV